MQPIHYDLAVCVVSLLAALYILVFKLRALNRNIYTPFLPAMVVVSGILYWGELMLVSFAAVYHHPEWLYQLEWQGTWGYTAGRILNGICWFMILALINTYLPMMRRSRVIYRKMQIRKK